MLKKGDLVRHKINGVLMIVCEVSALEAVCRYWTCNGFVVNTFYLEEFTRVRKRKYE